MAKKHSSIGYQEIEYSFWLTFDIKGAVTLTRGEPGLQAGQRTMSCTTTLPKPLFQLSALQAKIVVAPGAPAALKLDVTAAGESVAFDLAQELNALRVKYKMRTGEDA